MRASVGVEGHSEDRGTLTTSCVLDPRLIGRIMTVIRTMWLQLALKGLHLSRALFKILPPHQ